MGSIDVSENAYVSNGEINGSKGCSVQELDALIVGAGFGGVYQLKILRDAGYQVKLVEWGSDYGGVWYWNRYPGARVDSAIPHYEFSDPLIWKDWTWNQRFPDSSELRAYFAFVADKWDLRKDTQFNTFVSAATWDDKDSRWTVRTKAGEVYKVKYLLLNTGFAAKRYIPDWKGIDTYKGTSFSLPCVLYTDPYKEPSYIPHTGLTMDLIFLERRSPSSAQAPLGFNSHTN